MVHEHEHAISRDTGGLSSFTDPEYLMCKVLNDAFVRPAHHRPGTNESAHSLGVSVTTDVNSLLDSVMYVQSCKKINSTHVHGVLSITSPSSEL